MLVNNNIDLLYRVIQILYYNTYAAYVRIKRINMCIMIGNMLGLEKK